MEFLRGFSIAGRFFGINFGPFLSGSVFFFQSFSFYVRSAADVPGARFAHLGTLIEYLDIATRDSVFRPALSLSRVYDVCLSY